MIIEEILNIDCKMKEDEELLINNIKFILKNGILREVDTLSNNQKQTQNTFSYKWSKENTYSSDQVRKKTKDWLINKYFDNSMENLNEYIKKGDYFLDAGCGSSFSSMCLLDKEINNINYLGIDISDAVDIAKRKFEDNGLKGEFMQANILNLPFKEPRFNVIFSEGVLHHTDSTEKAISELSKLLLPDGKFLFYVYRKKSPIREFSDDYVREFIKDMDDETAWNELMSLTRLGKTLGDLNIEIDITEDIKFLGIPKGKINIQRLFYWHIFKAYYDEKYSLDEMNHINFDWYRPQNCHRHTKSEVIEYCKRANLIIEKINEEEAGISVIATKK